MRVLTHGCGGRAIGDENPVTFTMNLPCHGFRQLCYNRYRRAHMTSPFCLHFMLLNTKNRGSSVWQQTGNRRRCQTLPVSNVASYVRALLTLLLNSEKSKPTDLSAERGGMPSNVALLYFTGLLPPRKEVPRIYPSISRYIYLQSPSRSLLMNAGSGNLRY
jgi:hypothetical protein